MEISIFRNGEIWKAQVIIPKTNMNTIDLPPSNHKVNYMIFVFKLMSLIIKKKSFLSEIKRLAIKYRKIIVNLIK
jgi:hypothetical protein